MTLSKTKSLIALVFALALGSCKIVADKDIAAGQRNSVNDFEAKAWVANVWTAKAVAEFKAKAVDLATLLPAIEADPDKAGRTYGRGGGEGNPWSYEVKGEGKVTAIDVASLHSLMTVDITTPGGPRPVDLQIGPIIFGTALRDSLPFVRFGDFVNQIQFAEVSRALNDRATKHLRHDFDAKTIVGKIVSFYGSATAGSLSTRLSVTPIELTVVKGATP